MFGDGRTQKQFATKKEAEKYAREMRSLRKAMEEDRERERKNRVVNLSNLSERQRMDVHNGIELLDGRATLEEAADFFLTHQTPRKRMTLLEVLDEYMAYKTREGRRKKSLIDINNKVGRLAEDLGNVLVNEIFTKDLEAWLDKHKYTGTTRKGYRTQFNALFNFAKQHGYAAINPAANMARPIIEEKLPEAHKVVDVRKVFSAAEKSAPELIAYLAIGYFAGLRPHEINSPEPDRGIVWNDIDLSERLITIRPDVAKTRSRRVVRMSENLVEWLVAYGDHAKIAQEKLARRQGYGNRNGRIYMTRTAFLKVRQAAKVEWTQDVMRHSFASYHYAEHESRDLTMKQLGHSGSSDIFEKHFHNVVRPSEAAKCWNIAPSSKAKVIQMSA